MENIFYNEIKENSLSLLIALRQAEPENLTTEQKKQLQKWYTQLLQRELQRLTA